MLIVWAYVVKVLLSVLLFLVWWGIGKVLSLRFWGYFQYWLQKKYAREDDYIGDFAWMLYYMPFVVLLTLVIFIIAGIWWFKIAILGGTIGFFLGILLDLPLRNFFSFLWIVENHNFEIGGIIDIPSLRSPATIEEFTPFFVVLRDFDNHRILIDNFSFVKNATAIYQQIHRYEIVVPVEYFSDLEKIEEQFKEMLCQQKIIKEFIDCENVIINVKSFEASSIYLELKVPVYRYLLVKKQVPLLIFLSNINKILYKGLLMIAPVKAFNWLTFTIE